MNSPHVQRMRAKSGLSVHSSVDGRGGIRKQTPSRARSVSTSQAERLHHLALEQFNQSDDNDSLPPATIAPQWLTPQQSPQPHFYAEPTIESFPQWSVPTPPRSDSGVPSVSIDSNDAPVTTGISATQDFNFEQPTASAEMRFV